MQTADEQIKLIEAKVQQLVKAYQQSQKELLRLQQENASLKELLASHTIKTNELVQTIDVMKIQSLTKNDSTKKDLEQRINSYLKEIDKCLALLQT